MNDDDIARLSDDLKRRIRSSEPLSATEWQQALSVLTDPSRQRSELQPSHLAALTVKVTLDLAGAIQKMDRTSASLSRKLLFLNWALVVFTAVLLIEPAVHFFHWLFH